MLTGGCMCQPSANLAGVHVDSFRLALHPSNKETLATSTLYIMCSIYEKARSLSQYKMCFLASIGIPIIKIRWSDDGFIFITEIHIPGKTVYILKQSLACR